MNSSACVCDVLTIFFFDLTKTLYTAINIPVKLQKKTGSRKLPRYFCIHEACVGEKKSLTGGEYTLVILHFP